MAGIYIHIPFCKQACNYCNFHFSTSLHYKTDFIAALLQEIQLQSKANYLQNKQIESIYFGGGTPSLLSIDEVQAIMQAIHQHFTIANDAEITLEANPDDVEIEKLNGWKTHGINRLSIGIQSLFEEDLQWMNRAHTAEEAKQVISKAKAIGFNSFTVDLIYGTPGLTDKKWLSNINWVLQQNINHISCYALTVEENTALNKLILQNKKADVDAEQQSRQFILLMDALNKAGYEHYEISNFAKPGYRSKHNSNYWKGVYYLGLGPSAHSFNGISRQWNVANNQKYIHTIQQNNIPFEREELTPTQRLNEYIMTSIRLVEGCNLEYVKTFYGFINANKLKEAAIPFAKKGLLTCNNEHLVLTQNGKLFADNIAANLFF